MRAVRRGLVALVIASAHGFAAAAEESAGTVILHVRNGAAPVPFAAVSASGQHVDTDARGEVRLTLPAGVHRIAVSRVGFFPATLQVTVRGGIESTATVQLWEQRFEAKVVVVAATRSGTVVEDQPIRVEAVPQEEIEENLTIAPGNLSTLLNELGGVRVQTTSPSLGGTSLRLQGLRGRYTQILLDELPLYGAEPDAFSLLQVPPLDLAQVEVVKGTSSALYGGGALGGVVNLVSRRPGSDPELLLNQTSHGGTDAVGFVSGKLLGNWAYTLLGGAHIQSRPDLDHDGWVDVAGYHRALLRPRLYWDNKAGRSIFATVGATFEDRKGGSVEGATTAFREALDTRRLDGGLVGRFLVRGDRLVIVRSSLTSTRHRHLFGDDRERDLRSFALVEATLSGSDHGHTWLVGPALQRDAYVARDLPQFDYTYSAPALLVQDEYALGRGFAVSASGRVDFHDRYGAFFNPRLSALLRPAREWNVRLSAGTGYAAPVPFTDETEVVGLARVLPLRDLEPERARSGSLDVGWSSRGLELNGTLFLSTVHDPLVLRESSAQPAWFEIVNAPLSTRTYGSEFLGRLTEGPLQVILTYTYLHSTGSDRGGVLRRDVPLTPRHVAEIGAIYDKESRGRVGLEFSYTGRQRLEDDPYRDTGTPFLEVNGLAELRFGETGVFLNAVNLTDVRQTRFDPLLLPAPAPDGRRTTQVWAPLEGRVFNLGVRLEF